MADHPVPKSAHPGVYAYEHGLRRRLGRLLRHPLALGLEDWFPDLSEFNGVVDWGALGAAQAAGTISGVAIRAGFGTLRADNQFAANQAGARAHGIPVIYYWFNYPTFNTPQAEAAKFNSVVGPLGPGEAQCGDFEDDASASIFPRGQAGADWTTAFLGALKAPQNATWFYTYTSLYGQIGAGALASTWPFWWADYSARTDNPFGAIARQFTDCGSTPGVGGCCDQSNVLKAPLQQWLTPGGPAPVSSSSPGGNNMIGISYRPGDAAFRVDLAFVGSAGTMIHGWHNGASDAAGWLYEDLGGQFDARFGASCTWDSAGVATTFLGVGMDGRIYRKVIYGLEGTGNTTNPPTGWDALSPGAAPKAPPPGPQGPAGLAGPVGPAGPNTDAALRAALKAAIDPLP